MSATEQLEALYRVTICMPGMTDREGVVASKPRTELFVNVLLDHQRNPVTVSRKFLVMGGKKR